MSYPWTDGDRTNPVAAAFFNSQWEGRVQVAATAPTVDDDTTEGYAPGARWVNTATGLAYVLIDATTGAAVWREFAFPLTQMAGRTVVNVRLTDQASTHNARGSISSSQTIDYELGSYVSATITGTTTFTFSNPPASPHAGLFVLELINGGAHTINWPGSVRWPDGVAPTLTASGTDILTFVTRDGGTNWRGMVSMLDVKAP